MSQNMWSMCGQSQINKQFKGSLGYIVAMHTVLFMFLTELCTYSNVFSGSDTVSGVGSFSSEEELFD